MASALNPIFRPRSAAVIGASTDEQALGRQLLETMVRYGYHGKLYPVNPKATEICRLRCYPSVTAIPEPVEMAVVVVPRSHALAVLEGCGKRGVLGVVMITAGFCETGPEGAALSIRGYPVLAGVREQKSVNFSRLEEVITQLSQLVSDFDAIEELDMNPFFASERAEDCKAADAHFYQRQ